MFPWLRPILFTLDPEWAHDMVTFAGRLAVATPWGYQCVSACYSDAHRANPVLAQTIAGMTLRHPIGLAAGFDKNAYYIRLMQAMGFAFEEVGSVSALPAVGNPKPRLFRLPDDKALINRMGLNNDGARRIAPRCHQPSRTIPLGISLVKTHTSDILGEAALDDFAQSFRVMTPVADYLSLNVSCPNTADGKTFEDPKELTKLLDRLTQEQTTLDETPPWFIKLSLDLSLEQCAELMAVAKAYPAVKGWVIGNTSIRRDGLQTPLQNVTRCGVGGLSGRPLLNKACELTAHVYQLTDGIMPIMGVGGVQSADDAWLLMTHGASLIQVYTGLVYQGPSLVANLVNGLTQRLAASNYTHIRDIVGTQAGITTKTT